MLIFSKILIKIYLLLYKYFFVKKRGDKMASKKQVYWTSEEGLEIIAGWKRKGLTDAQVCKNLEINRSTLFILCPS